MLQKLTPVALLLLFLLFSWLININSWGHQSTPYVGYQMVSGLGFRSTRQSSTPAGARFRHHHSAAHPPRRAAHLHRCAGFEAVVLERSHRRRSRAAERKRRWRRRHDAGLIVVGTVVSSELLAALVRWGALGRDEMDDRVEIARAIAAVLEDAARHG